MGGGGGGEGNRIVEGPGKMPKTYLAGGWNKQTGGWLDNSLKFDLKFNRHF